MPMDGVSGGSRAGRPGNGAGWVCAVRVSEEGKRRDTCDAGDGFGMSHRGRKDGRTLFDFCPAPLPRQIDAVRQDRAIPGLRTPTKHDSGACRGRPLNVGARSWHVVDVQIQNGSSCTAGKVRL